MVDQKPFRVLSLDGGGMRGIYTAEYLSCLASGFSKRTGKGDLDLGKGFDLIVGTSTGAIVGCALVAGVPLGKVVSVYKDNGKLIFPRVFLRESALHSLISCDVPQHFGAGARLSRPLSPPRSEPRPLARYLAAERSLLP